MLRSRNKYCSNCLKSEPFLELDGHLICTKCSKRLEVVTPQQSDRDPSANPPSLQGGRGSAGASETTVTGGENPNIAALQIKRQPPDTPDNPSAI